MGDQLRASWAFYLPEAGGQMYYRTVVDAETRAVLKNTRLGAYQNSAAAARTRVSGHAATEPESRNDHGRASVRRARAGLFQRRSAGVTEGLDQRDRNGRQQHGHGHQSRRHYATPTPETAKSPTLDFSFPLQLGPGAPTPTAFKDAATTNLFYWINRIHDFYWHIGFDEAAGNFQVDNFGRGGLGGDPMYAYSQFAIARPGTALIDNSSFSFRNSSEDGFPGYVKMYLSGDHANNIFADGSYDAGVIIHEYTHGVSGRLGRDVYDTYQGRAMGEAWSDFFAWR